VLNSGSLVLTERAPVDQSFAFERRRRADGGEAFRHELVVVDPDGVALLDEDDEPDTSVESRLRSGAAPSSATTTPEVGHERRSRAGPH
jgi:hypothetical protein